MRAFIFPGQGSQSVGMGKALAEASRVARHLFEEVDEALGQKLARRRSETIAAEQRLRGRLRGAMVALQRPAHVARHARAARFGEGAERDLAIVGHAGLPKEGGWRRGEGAGGGKRGDDEGEQSQAFHVHSPACGETNAA